MSSSPILTCYNCNNPAVKSNCHVKCGKIVLICGECCVVSAMYDTRGCEHCENVDRQLPGDDRAIWHRDRQAALPYVRSRHGAPANLRVDPFDRKYVSD